MKTIHEIVDITTLDQSNLILFVDVDYRADGTAKVSGVVTDSWTSNKCVVYSTIVPEVEPYEPGAFYRREMPCIIALLYATQQLRYKTIVVDGYVTLGEDQHYGLGAHLYRELAGTIPVVGVAKTYFNGTPDNQAVLRNGSTKELYVTALGMDHEAAKLAVANMHGEFRLPTLLKLVDQSCRE
jgi:deoxyribonuclease V